jgi:hypothetical protein
MLVRWKVEIIRMTRLVDAVGLNGGINQLGYEFTFKILKTINTSFDCMVNLTNLQEKLLCTDCESLLPGSFKVLQKGSDDI